MLSDQAKPASNLDSALSELARLRCFAGAPVEFWPAYLAAAARVAQASRGLLIVRDPQQPGRLKKLGDWSDNGHSDRSALTFTQGLPALVENCVRAGKWKEPLEAQVTGQTKHFALAVSLPLPSSQESCVAAFLVSNTTDAQAGESLIRLQMIADVPLAYQTNQGALQSKNDVEKFASVLDVLVLVNAERRFLAAALAFCNGLAARFQCDRVSLGWLENGYVRLKTISRTERFDRNMAAVKSVEVAMEESLDQDEEIVWPAPEGLSVITRDHQSFAQEHRSGNVCSVPLRTEGKPVAVLTCERLGQPFSQIEQQQLRLACDQVIVRLADLKRHDRWFGARWAASLREKLAKALGPEHTWAKVLALTGAAVLILLCVPIFTYKVEGNFILRSDELSFLTAPFDGYIKEVMVRPGDLLTNNASLLRLNTDDLLLEEAAALADQSRYLRETEKARAANSLAEMRIAQALADQATAHLELLRHRLNQALIKAPFDGVVVEGDLRQRIGAPVKQGEALVKVARTDRLYAEAQFNERDVHEILNKTEGELAFVTQPKWKFPVKIIRLEPAAFPKEGENVFVVRCALGGQPESWWRPGMSGICKFPVEKRTLLWILTHRTVDFLRMFLWW
jgi:hypothetical protein